MTSTILKLLAVNAEVGNILQLINLKVDEMLRELDAGNSGNVGLDDFLRCNLQGVFFTGTSPKSSKYKKVNPG